jgi:hypothetical protein
MRNLMLLPLALAAVTAAGCRTASEGTEQAALDVPQRDLTLQQADAPEVEIASPVELGRRPTERPRSRSAPRSPGPAPVPPPEAAESGAAPAAPAPVAAPAEATPVALAAMDAEPPDPHALPPGRSVTVIPASSGAAADEGWSHVRPEGREPGIVGGEGPHGGGCKPRGPGGMPGVGRPETFR